MRKEELVATRLPQSLVTELKKIESVEQSDRSTVLRKLLAKSITDWKKEYASKLYAESKVTLERAAMEAGVSIREMMDYLKAKKVHAQYSLEDLEEDMRNFYKSIG